MGMHTCLQGVRLLLLCRPWKLQPSQAVTSQPEVHPAAPQQQSTVAAAAGSKRKRQQEKLLGQRRQRKAATDHREQGGTAGDSAPADVAQPRATRSQGLQVSSTLSTGVGQPKQSLEDIYRAQPKLHPAMYMPHVQIMPHRQCKRSSCISPEASACVCRQLLDTPSHEHQHD